MHKIFGTSSVYSFLFPLRISKTTADGTKLRGRSKTGRKVDRRSKTLAMSYIPQSRFKEKNKEKDKEKNKENKWETYTLLSPSFSHHLLLTRPQMETRPMGEHGLPNPCLRRRRRWRDRL